MKSQKILTALLLTLALTFAGTGIGTPVIMAQAGNSVTTSKIAITSNTAKNAKTNKSGLSQTSLS